MALEATGAALIDENGGSPGVSRAEVGKHHHISGQYLNSYAGELAWLEDNRREPNGTQFLMIAAASLGHPVSRQWKGYWQR